MQLCPKNISSCVKHGKLAACQEATATSILKPEMDKVEIAKAKTWAGETFEISIDAIVAVESKRLDVFLSGQQVFISLVSGFI